MNGKRQSSQSQRRWISGAVGATIAALVGLGLLTSRFGDSVTRHSYDLPFFCRSKLIHKSLPTEEVRLVYLDDLSHKELNQPMNLPWDRSLHAQFIDRLTAEGAKLIVFDIIFTDPSKSPEADQQMADAIRKSGRVILAGNFQPKSADNPQDWEEFPYAPFLAGAKGWGNPNVFPDSDGAVRHFFPNKKDIGGTNISWMPWLAAKLAGQQNLPEVLANLWFNFTGPGSLEGLSYYRVLKGDFPQGTFRDKIVFVGQHVTAGFTGANKDDFRTPYSEFGVEPSPGVDFHATATLNFLHHNWLSQPPELVEILIDILIGVAFGLGLVRLPPLWATAAALGGMLAVAVAEHLLVWYAYVWFSWLIIVVEIALALFSAIIANSLQLYVDKRLLQESLAARLSPAIAKRVIEDPALRSPGGVKEEISIVYTDIANFSRVAEMMNADDLVNLLNRYFDAALKCIFDNDGTVMDLVGDAIFAIWNAPTKQANHRELACRAAMSLHRQLIEFEENSRQLLLRTRVGLHTGIACVANIGSAVRFDYTAVGEAINLASRLEGLNKHLGTYVLATREIQRAVEADMTSRLVGYFKFKGFGRAVEIHELIGPKDEAERSRKWRDEFADALQLLRQRKLDAAVEKFQAVSKLRQEAGADKESQTNFLEGDGPSRFYLRRIEEFRSKPPSSEWMGEIDLTEK